MLAAKSRSITRVGSPPRNPRLLGEVCFGNMVTCSFHRGESCLECNFGAVGPAFGDCGHGRIVEG